MSGDRYNNEALWRALQDVSAALDESKQELEERDRERDRSRNRVSCYEAELKKLRVALDAVLDGRARVTQEGERGVFVVRFRGEWPHVVGGKPEDLALPAAKDSPRGPVPANAAHVGSSNQGQVGQ